MKDEAENHSRGKKVCGWRQVRGFTFVELLVVIAIIGLLSTLSMVGYGEAKKRANIAKTQHYLGQVSKAIMSLSVETGLWPGGQTPDTVCTDLPLGCPPNNELCEDGCAFSLDDPEAGLLSTDGSYPEWKGPYIGMILQDSWGNGFFFDTDYDLGGGNNAAVVGSYGPNGIGNNLYDSDDIIFILAQ